VSATYETSSPAAATTHTDIETGIDITTLALAQHVSSMTDNSSTSLKAQRASLLALVVVVVVLVVVICVVVLALCFVRRRRRQQAKKGESEMFSFSDEVSARARVQPQRVFAQRRKSSSDMSCQSGE
jgi:preprotein translocase subunit SecG